MQFSVLLSVYVKEDEHYFDQALESITNQTLMPNEILIVEDGALTPGLQKVIEKYQSKYPKIIQTLKLKTNAGLGLALNAGIKACKYDYIARMDTDDIATPERFEKQMAFISQHPEVDVIGSNITEYDETMKNVLSIREVPQHEDEIYHYLKHRNPFNHMSVIYKKQAILSNGNYEDCLYFEDYYLWCKLAASKSSFYNIPESLVKVRAGDALFNRRGGLHYIKHIYTFERKIYKLKVIDLFDFITNVAKRVSVSIAPNKVRALIYKNILRKIGK